MPINNFKFALVIPTINAERDNWSVILDAVALQALQPDYKLILDSASTDETVSIAEAHGFEIHPVQPGEFDHAGTRKWGIELVKDRCDIIIFMTQDALLDNSKSFQYLINSFNDAMVAVAYGRQLPRDNASPIETFGRLFHYPDAAETRTLDDKNRLGMKTAFCSDSFAAYNIELVTKLDAFPVKSIVGEDYITAARMMENGYKLRYAADATVKHSHDYTIKQEFNRYFDIGVFHQEYADLIKRFGSTENAGAGFVVAELRYLLKNRPTHIPLAILRTFSKYLGYSAGKLNKRLSNSLRRKLSMHSYYFQ